jgi:hypothetical protein
MASHLHAREEAAYESAVKILIAQETLVHVVRQHEPSDELLMHLQMLEMYAKDSGDPDYNIRIQALRERLYLVYPTWTKKRSHDGHVRLLPSSMVQLILELLQPEEIASCMMVCKAWMGDAKQHPKAWRGKTLHVYTNPPRSCNPIYREPWTCIALRHVESVMVCCPLIEPPRVPSSPLFFDVNGAAITHISPIPGGEMKNTPYACLLRGLVQGTLPNILKVEVGDISIDAFNQLCDILSKQRELHSVVLRSASAGLKLEQRLNMLLNCNFRHIDVIKLSDFKYIREAQFRKFRDALLANRSLESLVVPGDRFLYDPQAYDNTYSEFMSLILPRLLEEAPGRGPPLKRLEIRLQDEGVGLSTIIGILRTYGRFGLGDSQLEFLRITNIKMLYQYKILPKQMHVYARDANVIADLFRKSALQPTSRLRIEMVIAQVDWPSEVFKHVYALALEMLTPDERLLASQRVLLK